jgi:hypothetical protein
LRLVLFALISFIRSSRASGLELMEKEIFCLGVSRIRILIIKALSPPMATPFPSIGRKDSKKAVEKIVLNQQSFQL